MDRKMIITTTVVVLSALVGYGLYKANGLRNIYIVKSITVKSAPQKAFEMVRYLRNFPKWSPFLAQDPSQKFEVKGIDGEIGAQYHWNGNKGKDLGYQEIVKIDSLKFVGIKCNIEKPFIAQPTFEYSFKETPNGIEITQDFRLHSALKDAFFMSLFGVKKAIDQTNQQGMDLLKKAIEE